MYFRKRYMFLIILVFSLIFVSGCNDDPPPGLMRKIQHAILGILLNCPQDKCPQPQDGVVHIPITTSSTEKSLKKIFNMYSKHWCPNWVNIISSIAPDYNEFSQARNYGLKISGFGTVHITSNDFKASVKSEKGWKVIIDHTAHLPSTLKYAACPKNWVQMKCSVKCKMKIDSKDEVDVSWQAGGEMKSASGDITDKLDITPRMYNWCNNQPHKVIAKDCQCPKEE